MSKPTPTDPVVSVNIHAEAGTKFEARVSQPHDGRVNCYLTLKLGFRNTVFMEAAEAVDLSRVLREGIMRLHEANASLRESCRACSDEREAASHE